MLQKGTPAGKRLPPGYTPSEVTEEGKETTKNWFYKVASIRELVPRFYVELSILRCYRLLIDASELPGIVQRLARMIRGFGDPLAATYARSYLVHKAIDLTPSHAYLLVKEPVLDTLTVFERQLAFAPDDAEGKHVRGLHHVKMEITTSEYFGTFQPALEWLLNSLAEYHPTQATLVALIKKYREQCKAAIVLNAVISSFDASVIAANALPMCDLIKESDARGYSRHHLYVSLGRVLCSHPPPRDELLQVRTPRHSSGSRGRGEEGRGASRGVGGRGEEEEEGWPARPHPQAELAPDARRRAHQAQLVLTALAPTPFPPPLAPERPVRCTRPPCPVLAAGAQRRVGGAGRLQERAHLRGGGGAVLAAAADRVRRA